MNTPRRPTHLTDEDRQTFHQLAVLAAEEDASAAWLHTLRQLVAQGLPDDEFTAARLTALRDWKRDLGRRLARIRWQFDERRPARLIARDARRVRAVAQQRIAALTEATSAPAQPPRAMAGASGSNAAHDRSPRATHTHGDHLDRARLTGQAS